MEAGGKGGSGPWATSPPPGVGAGIWSTVPPPGSGPWGQAATSPGAPGVGLSPGIGGPHSCPPPRTDLLALLQGMPPSSPPGFDASDGPRGGCPAVPSPFSGLRSPGASPLPGSPLPGTSPPVAAPSLHGLATLPGGLSLHGMPPLPCAGLPPALGVLPPPAGLPPPGGLPPPSGLPPSVAGLPPPGGLPGGLQDGLPPRLAGGFPLPSGLPPPPSAPPQRDGLLGRSAAPPRGGGLLAASVEASDAPGLGLDEQELHPWEHWDEEEDYEEGALYEEEEEVEVPVTAVVLSNIPNNFTKELVVSWLEQQGYANAYDFLYVPIDHSCHENLGYFLVNFKTPEDAARFTAAFHGTLAQKCFPGTSFAMACEVRPAAVHGTQANILRVRLHNVHGLANSAKAAGYDNAAARHLQAEAAAFQAAKTRAELRAQQQQAAAAGVGPERDHLHQVRQQIEFYFSSDNLGSDQYLRSLMDPHGWIDLIQLVKFPRLKSQSVSVQMAAAALRDSTLVEVSPDGKRVRQSNSILREVFQAPPSHPKSPEPQLAPSVRHVLAPSGLATPGLTSTPAPPGLTAEQQKIRQARQAAKDEVYF